MKANTVKIKEEKSKNEAAEFPGNCGLSHGITWQLNSQPDIQGECVGRAGEESQLINREADEGPCRPPRARDRREHPADSGGRGRSPSILADSHQTTGGKGLPGPWQRGRWPCSSNHGNRHWPAEALVPEFLASIWQRPSFSCKPSTDSFPPRVGAQGMNATRRHMVSYGMSRHQGRVQEAQL